MTDANDNSGGAFGRGGRETAPSGPIIPQSPSQALRPEKLPPPPKRSRRARSQVVIVANFLMSLIVLVAIVALAAVYFGKVQFEAPGPLAQSTNFVVREGMGVNQIASGLERQDIVSDSRIFRIASAYYLRGDTLKAGEYEIKAHASMREIMDLLRSGKSILYSLTLPEGLTVAQILDRMRENEALEGDLPAEAPAEGTLLPETYKFTRGTTRLEMIDKMRAAHDALVDQIWEHRAPDIPVKTKEEFVTLASIVEKETGRADERPRVAAVFMNRLRKGMRLQSDPTVIYGLFGGEGKPADRPLYRSDLDKETPYNTYVIKGLPPTPIANPGRAALEAVADPSRTDDLYFVADGTGGHVFASSLDEHNANVRRWREIEAQRAKEAEKAGAAGDAGAKDGAAAPQ